MAYRKIDCRIWGDAKFVRLSDEAKLLWFFLLTCPFTTSLPGVLVCGPSGMAEALGWDAKGFAKPFGELFRERLLRASWEVPEKLPVEPGTVRLVWLPNATRYNQPENPNVVKGWQKHWELVPECPLKAEIFQALEECAKGLGKGFAEAFDQWLAKPFRKGSGNGSGNGMPNGMPNQDPEQEPEPEPEQDPEGDARGGGRMPPSASARRPTSVSQPKRVSRVQPDLSAADLTPVELEAYQSLVCDESLNPIIKSPAKLARDLCKLVPGLNVAAQIVRAGVWLRANPTKAKTNGNRFLANWLAREQDRNGGRGTPPNSPAVQPASATQLWKMPPPFDPIAFAAGLKAKEGEE